MSRFAYTCESGWEVRLIDELQRVFPQSRHRQTADGWVVGNLSDDEPIAVPSVALCSQCLPQAEAIEAESISAWGQAAGERIVAGFENYPRPWRLHVFGVYRVDGPVGRRRGQLIREHIESLLRKRQRRLLRTQTAAEGPWAPGEALVQVGLTSATNGYFSLCEEPLRLELRRLISPFAGGVAEIPADRRAPSRAFAKLVEAELRFGQRISAGQTCIDLGSSPGSWAYVALNRGARVVAIDRSPLRSDLMANPALTFLRGDAFGYKPPEMVDWLLCDVIAFPQRIIELLQTWVAVRWCRRFCVTIKFRGTVEYSLLEPLKAWLAAAGTEFILRRLTNNKNEVTAIGELTDRPAFSQHQVDDPAPSRVVT
jgi:23S rRNA (cytidine2498-2'-O)-methyltransferase